jgi:hypothetical protein
MLFFELFPAFMAVVALIVGAALLIADRNARRDESAPSSEGDR